MGGESVSVRVVCRVRPINKNEEKKGEKSVVVFKGKAKRDTQLPPIYPPISQFVTVSFSKKLFLTGLNPISAIFLHSIFSFPSILFHLFWRNDLSSQLGEFFSALRNVFESSLQIEILSNLSTIFAQFSN